ncbi:hypothetical protein AAES_44217 [Amazona aestiva]|uniref:Uncharacterized protein n=1 Tax=Amazona aestiva TaxID=12930 RepID=A0A0Q3Q9K6_AMAAE|nr:hypothetical protein AAES_44217 [Amazona aestiva]
MKVSITQGFLNCEVDLTTLGHLNSRGSTLQNSSGSNCLVELVLYKSSSAFLSVTQETLAMNFPNHRTVRSSEKPSNYLEPSVVQVTLKGTGIKTSFGVLYDPVARGVIPPLKILAKMFQKHKINTDSKFIALKILMYPRIQMGLSQKVMHSPTALGFSSALSIASKIAASDTGTWLSSRILFGPKIHYAKPGSSGHEQEEALVLGTYESTQTYKDSHLPYLCSPYLSA